MLKTSTAVPSTAKPIEMVTFSERIDDQRFSVPTLSHFKQRLDQTFLVRSLEHMAMSLIIFNPFRDNYAKIVIVYREEDMVSDTGNFLLINKMDQHAIPVLRKFKGRERYQKEEINGNPITGELYGRLIQYIADNEITDTLFDTNLRDRIKTALSALGIRGIEGTNCVGVYNFFRHLIVSDFLSVPRTTEERIQLAKIMGHSINMQGDYRRPIDANYFLSV